MFQKLCSGFCYSRFTDSVPWFKSTGCCVQASVPSVLNRLKDVNVSVGDVAVFTCRVCGKPLPSIVWTGPDQMQISNSTQTLCDYSDDGLARLQVSALVIWLIVLYLVPIPFNYSTHSSRVYRFLWCLSEIFLSNVDERLIWWCRCSQHCCFYYRNLLLSLIIMLPDFYLFWY